MTTLTVKYKVGIVEEQPDWIDMFKRRLKDDFELVIFPLTEDLSKEQLVEQIEAKEVDCLIADYDLKETDLVGFNGDEVVEEYRKKFPYFPVFIISSKEEEDILRQIHDNEIVRVKDELTQRTPVLIQRVKNKIENYYSEIRKAEEKITELITKRNNGNDLSIEEEAMLTEKYQFLEKIDPSSKAIPDNLIQPESITQLQEFVANTKTIIEQLKALQK